MPTTDPAPAPDSTAAADGRARRAENRPLRVALYLLMTLYILITGWLIYQHEIVGTTQLGYSSLHADQLKELQDGMMDLIKAVELMRQQERIGAAIVETRLEVLEKGNKQLAAALQSTANADLERVQALAARVTELAEQTTAVTQNLRGLSSSQQQLLASVNAQLGQVQKGLADTATALANQREQVTTALRSDVAQMRSDLAQALKSSSVQNRQQLLALLAEETLLRARAVTKVDETNLVEVWQMWRQTELWTSVLATDPALAARAKSLGEESRELSKGLIAAVSAAVAKHNRVAMTAPTPEAARAAFVKAGEFLQFLPATTEPAAQQAAQNLYLAHEAVRQRLEQKQTP